MVTALQRFYILPSYNQNGHVVAPQCLLAELHISFAFCVALRSPSTAGSRLSVTSVSFPACLLSCGSSPSVTKLFAQPDLRLMYSARV